MRADRTERNNRNNRSVIDQCDVEQFRLRDSFKVHYGTLQLFLFLGQMPTYLRRHRRRLALTVFVVVGVG